MNLSLQQEKSFCLFELAVFELFNIKPFEMEQMSMYTIHFWIREKERRQVEAEKKAIFEEMVRKNARRN